MIDKNILLFLRDKKNLLAFSGGVDSTALFFLLLKEKINFDIAIVNYNLRKEAEEEINYAKELAIKYNKKIYIKSIYLNESNFEKRAREVRYNFFEEIIKRDNYDRLLTAHQLNDRLEWFLMQFTKGAGVVELLGFEKITKRDFYYLVRPLINHSKEDLQEFLEREKIKYFIDSSNFLDKYKRNYFRKNFSNRLIKEYKDGIKRSFNYLQKDKDDLLNIEILYNKKLFYILKSGKNDNENIRIIDKILKKLGIILSSSQKEEILKSRDIVIGGKFAIVIEKEKIYISPFLKMVMSKEFKEICRVKKIPPKVRSYLYSINFNFR